MGKRRNVTHKIRNVTHKKRNITRPLSDDSGISLEGSDPLTRLSPDTEDKVSKLQNMEEVDHDMCPSASTMDPIGEKNDSQMQDKPVANSSYNFSRQFSFEVEENYLDYEPEDPTSRDENNFGNDEEAFEEDSYPQNMKQNTSTQQAAEFGNELIEETEFNSSNGESVHGDESPLSDEMSIVDDESNNFLINANVNFNGTNITIVRPTIQSNPVTKNTASAVIENEANFEGEPLKNNGNVSTERFEPRIDLSSITPPSLEYFTKNKITNTGSNCSGNKAWLKTSLDLDDPQITSKDPIFFYNIKRKYDFRKFLYNSGYSEDISQYEMDNASECFHSNIDENFDNSSLYSENTFKSGSIQNISQTPTYDVKSSEGRSKLSNLTQIILKPSNFEEDHTRRTQLPSLMDIELQMTDKNEMVTRWLNTNDISIDHLIETLCENHFINNCENFRCSKSHLPPHQVEERIKHLPPQKLNEIYRLVQGKRFLYAGLFSTFVEYFKVSEFGRDKLNNMIRDVFTVFDDTFIDKTIYIQKIIKALQDTGLSFKEAIEYIFSLYGTSMLTLSDILLFIISKEPNLDQHWCFVRKFLCNRKEELDHEVVTNLLNTALNYPQNKELWRAIHDDIIKNNSVTSGKIPSDLLKKILQIILDMLVNGDSSPTATFSETLSYSEFTEDGFEATQKQGKFNLHEQDSTFPQNIDSYSTYSLPNAVENYTRNPLFDRPFRVNNTDNNIPSRDIQRQHFVMGSSETNNSGRFYSTNETLENESVFKIPNCLVKKKKERKNDTDNMTRPNSQPMGAYSEKVLKKVSHTLNRPPRPQTPANIVAHPTKKPSIDFNYQCNISLHNLYPHIHIDATEISRPDFFQLKEALETLNVGVFLDIFSKYQDSYAIQNFILHTLTFLKDKRSNKILNKFVSLQVSLEKHNPNYMEERPMKMLIEVLAMNLIYHLERKGGWNFCRSILLTMKKKDWHSLVTSKIFFCKSHLMSHMHRYMYIIHVLIKAEDFHWANEIFQCNVLNLLEPTSRWPFQYVQSDIEVRNQVLSLFFNEGFTLNIVVINDLLKHIAIVMGGKIENFDVWPLFNEKLCDILDEEEKYKSTLHLLCGDIINYYGRYMTKDVLQGYMLYMKNDIHEADAFKLYKICCEKGAYIFYSGKERVIKVQTKFNDFEINLLLKQFLENIENGSFFPHDFHIELELSEPSQSSKPKILQNRLDRNAFSILESIVNILRINFNIIVQRRDGMRISVSREMLDGIFC